PHRSPGEDPGLPGRAGRDRGPAPAASRGPRGDGHRPRGAAGPAPSGSLREGVPKPDAGELRKLVAGTLPEFLVPATFVHLAQLPRTPSDQVDRRALPAPEEERTDRPYAPPETETEELLAGIFAELLEVRAVGIYESSFDLGGHSLLAMRLTTRVRDALHVDLPLRGLFAAPSIARLAAVVEELIIAQLEELSDEEVERLTQGF
ncbi:MAG: hypothetical protein GY856_09210, partial [bacterium]|nr:hypothetical protein [bacterium]